MDPLFSLYFYILIILLMNYQQTLDYLFSHLPLFQRLGKAAYKADLNNTYALDTYFKHPHLNFKTIHIAGTNGKGSISHMLASILQKAGYKVGLYTSPHLKDFRERIRINGSMIPEQEVVNFVEIHRNILESIKPSFFEMAVAMAFDYFSRSRVDIAVIEVGLGGRLDSTNIITPILSLITNISLDHTDLLGDTIEKIAVEKAGIIKADVPVIISRTQPEISQIFTDNAKRINAPVFFADQHYHVVRNSLMNNQYQQFEVNEIGKSKFINILVDLCGSYQSRNLPGVLMAVDILKEKGISITEDQMLNGLKGAAYTTGLQGRWQKINEKPLVICDTGHNVDGIAMVVEQISKMRRDKLHMVIGMVGDKDIDGVLTLLPKDAKYYFTKASIPRALDEKILQQRAMRFNLCGETYSTVLEAYEAALGNAGDSDFVFIGGSTFVVAEVV